MASFPCLRYATERFIRLEHQPSDLKKTVVAQLTSKKDKQALSFHWKNALQRTFFVPGGEFPFTVINRDKMPRSFSENLGFFLAWFFWIGLFLTPFLLARQKEGKIYSHFFWLILIWFGAIIAGFSSSADVSDLRFLNFAYVPAILLFPMITNIIQIHFFNTSKKQLWFLILFFIGSTYTLLTNYALLAKEIRHFGGLQSAIARAERDVFHDFYQRPPVGAELYERHQELEQKAVIVNWYQLQSAWLRKALEQLKQEKVLYFYTRKPEPEQLKRFRNMGHHVELWKRYDFLDAKPLIFKVFKKISRLKKEWTGNATDHELLIYRIRPMPAQ